MSHRILASPGPRVSEGGRVSHFPSRPRVSEGGRVSHFAVPVPRPVSGAGRQPKYVAGRDP